MATAAAAATPTHIYKLDALDALPTGPSSAQVTPLSRLAGDASSAVGAALTGQRVQVALLRMARGTGSALQSHANEQFSYVLQGALTADIDGQVCPVPTGHVAHIPAGMPHRLVAGADADALVYVIKDTRTGMAGELPAGAKHEAQGLQAPRTQNVTGKKVCYVYDIANLNAVPDYATSADVIPRNFISKKSSSFGAALRGEKLQVGHIHKGVGSGTKLHTHPNEQFSFVLDGTMIYQIGGETIEAPPMSATHIPPGLQHSAIASAAGDVLTFVAKDTSHGMSGPPVDGIEDGPVYLPGFGPKKNP